jgi:MFS family permease
VTYLSLLRSNSRIRTLWFINLISGFGSWFSVVAIYTLLIRFDASPLIIALAAALHWLPGALQAPISGTVVDRSDTKKLMIILLLVETLATVMMIAVDSAELVWLLLLLVFVKMSSASFFFTAEMALIPSLVSKEELRTANDINSITWSLTFVVGMATGGLFVEYFGIMQAFILDALTFLLALIFLWRLNIPAYVKNHTESFFHFVRAGFSYIKEHPFLIHLILLHATVGFTAFDALVTLLARDYYSAIVSEPLAIGFINAVRALGLAVGPFFFIYVKDQKKLLGFLLVGQGAAILLWSALQGSYYLSFVGIFLTGFFTTTIWSLTYSLIQSHVAKAYYGRVIAYNDMVFLFTNAVVSVMIGLMAGSGIALETITAILGALFFVSAVYYKAIRPRLG